MDYTPPLCTACHYRLPMTWTSVTEMYKMLTAAGWSLSPAVCPQCRRKKWLEENKRKVSAQTAVFKS